MDKKELQQELLGIILNIVTESDDKAVNTMKEKALEIINDLRDHINDVIEYIDLKTTIFGYIVRCDSQGETRLNNKSLLALEQAVKELGGRELTDKELRMYELQQIKEELQKNINESQQMKEERQRGINKLQQDKEELQKYINQLQQKEDLQREINVPQQFNEIQECIDKALQRIENIQESIGNDLQFIEDIQESIDRNQQRREELQMEIDELQQEALPLNLENITTEQPNMQEQNR